MPARLSCAEPPWLVFVSTITLFSSGKTHSLLALYHLFSGTAPSELLGIDDVQRNVVGRVESSWRPASTEEGFAIVRRRLFEPLTDPTQFRDRDVVARAFAELYRTQQQEFPPECHNADYAKRLRAAYPIHPEVFDHLYTDWSTLAKFKRTRGVLRLMAAVIFWAPSRERRSMTIGSGAVRTPSAPMCCECAPLERVALY